MPHLLRWSLITAFTLGMIACSKANTVNPDDAALVRRIDATIEQIRQAYIRKDASAFHTLLMPLDSLRRLEDEVERDFAVYDRINLDFSIDRVLVEDTDVGVYFHWQGQWERKTDPQPLRERGHAIIRLVGHQNLALSGVEGDTPFGMYSRRLPVERQKEP